MNCNALRAVVRANPFSKNWQDSNVLWGAQPNEHCLVQCSCGWPKGNSGNNGMAGWGWLGIVNKLLPGLLCV